MSIYQMALMGGSAGRRAVGPGGEPEQRAGEHRRCRGARPAGAAADPRRFAWTAARTRTTARTAPGSAAPAPLVEPQPDEGPVMVTVEYLIDPARAADFIADDAGRRAAPGCARARLSWGLFRDPAVPGRYLEYFLDETWVEHLRRLSASPRPTSNCGRSAWPSTPAARRRP
jgi:hypothetical protein